MTAEAPQPIEMLAARLHQAAAAWRGPRGMVWLDSGGARDSAFGRESVLTAFPRAVRRWSDDDAQSEAAGGLGGFLDGLVRDAPLGGGAPGGRFRGGWLGFLGYEAAAALEPVVMHAVRDVPVPVASWALHDVWFRHVPDEARLELWSAPDAEDHGERPELSAWLHWAEDAMRAPDDNTTPMWAPPEVLQRVTPATRASAEALVARADRSLPRAAFEAAVRTVQGAIREGEVFQANVAQRVSLDVDADPFAAYVQLRRLNPSPFACFIQEDWGSIVSNSPERLFQVTRSDGVRWLRARPIAGTCPRGGDEVENARAVARMVASAKERAEHTMLVDLVRNDVGRVAEPGSVRVAEFQVVEAYSHVHHLVSDVVGRLRGDARLQDVVRAMFPGGTITGAPKLRSMEVIDRVEPVMRGPYTGSVGYVNGDGTADWNILIRTMVWTPGRVHVYAGAGVVADSEPAHEYEETLHKAAAMLVALATVRGGLDGQDGQDDPEADADRLELGRPRVVEGVP